MNTQTKLNLKIVGVQNKGDASKEYILFEVLESCDLGWYLVADTTFVGEKVSNVFRHTYLFPGGQVAKGDLICLFTRKGSHVVVDPTPQNLKQHHYFWNSSSPIWNDGGDTAALFLIADWTKFKKN